MRQEIKVFLVFILFGSLFWILDSALDTYLFDPGGTSFLGNIFSDIPGSEIFDRLSIMIAWVIGGVIAFYYVQKLNRTRKRLTNFFTNATDGIFIADREWKLTDVNPRGLSMAGCTLEELKSRKFTDLLSDDERQRFEQHLSKTTSGDEMLTETRLIAGDGSQVPVEVSGKYMSDGQLFGIVRDISDRKKSEQALKAERDRAQDYLDIAPVIFLALDNEGRISMVNRRGCEILGFESEKELLGTNWFQNFLPEKIRDEYWIKFQDFIKQDFREVVWRDENYVVTRTGEERLITWHNINIKDKQADRTASVLSSGIDITDIKTTEKALSESEAKFQNLVETMNEGFSIVDENFRFTYVNRKFCEMLGYSNDEIIGLTTSDFVDPEFYQVIDRELEVTNFRKTSWYDVVLLNKKGERVHTIASPKPIFDSNGNFRGSYSTMTDITELKRTEKILQDTLNKYQTITEEQKFTLENVNDFIYRHDREGVFIYISPSVERITGYDIEDWLTSYTKYMTDHPDNRKVIEFTDIALKTGVRQPPYIVEIYHKEGNRIKLEVNEAPFFENGEVSGIIGVARDVTMRNHSENLVRMQRDIALELSVNRQLDQSLNRILGILAELDEIDGGGVYLVNRSDGSLSLIAYTGLSDEFASDKSYYTADSLNAQLVMKGDPVFTIYNELDLVHNELCFREKIRAFACIPLKYENEVIGALNLASRSVDEFPDSTRAALESIGAQIGGAVARVQSEHALKASEERFRSIFSNASIGISLRDINGKCIQVNSAWERMFGYKQDEILGLDHIDLTHPDERDSCRESWTDLQSGKITYFNGKRRYIRKNGSEFWGDLSITSIRDQNSRILAFIGLIVDITKRKIAEDALQQKNIELEKALKIKDEFMSMVSHELRTPLVPIIGYSELLLEGTLGKLPDEAVDPVKAILNRAEDLTNLIDDLLFLSRLEKGKLKLRFQPCSVRSHVMENIEDYSRINHGKEVRLEYSGEDFYVLADHTRLHQIIRNLIDNAIKYSEDKVRIQIKTEKNENMGLISVTDNGIGVAREHLSKIFERFYQVEETDTRRHGGTGLGLAIINDITKIMGGNIMVESEPGIGSTFTVYLPLVESGIFNMAPCETGADKDSE